MTETEALLTLLRETFREALPHRKLPADDAPLFGDGGPLDSMDLVNFAADVEDAVNARFGADVVVADARALSRSRSPFRSLRALAEWCAELLDAAA
ncbi:MAG: hypothetical protein KC620_20055 [Myxococcales bacterium]|nr:hypothetical protein [Myxococcales bacterium]